jgi:hypothetical protein
MVVLRSAWAEQFLHRADVVAVLEPMGSEAMTPGVTARGLGDAGLAYGGLHRALDGLLVQVVTHR